MKDEKKFVIDTLKDVYGITDIAENEFISDENPEEVDDEKVKALFKLHDKDKINKVKTKSFDDGAKAREKKVKSEIETALKTEFGINEDADDIDALIKMAASRKPVAKLDDLTSEMIEALPHVIKLKGEFQKKINEKESEFNEKLTAKEKADKEKEVLGRVNAKAIKLLTTDRNPVLPDDKTKAERRIRKDLIEELNSYGWLENEDGERVPLGRDGKQLTTDNDVLVSEDDLIEMIINENFDFVTTQEPAKRSAQQGKPDPKKINGNPPVQGEAYKGTIPTSEEDYIKLINDRSLSVEERKSIQRQYKKKKGL